LISEEVDPVFAGVLAGLTPDRLIYGGTAGALTSVSNLASWIAGTSNQVTVTDDTDGTITLSLPQDIHTGASPTFASLNLTSDVLLKGSGGEGLESRNISDTAYADITAKRWIIGSGQIIADSSGITVNPQASFSITCSTIPGGCDLNFTAGDSNLDVAVGGNVSIQSGDNNQTGGVSGDINLIIPAGAGGSGVIYCNGSTRIQSLSGLLKGTTGVVSAITDNSANWDTAYADRLKWDGGATDLVVATARTSLGLGVADTPSFTGLISGVDAATNTAGTLKLWSAGANNYSTLFTAGTQTANATYTLPTAMPPSVSQFLQCTTAGVLSWASVAVPLSFGTTTKIPYMNVAGTDFLYSANLTFDGTNLVAAQIKDSGLTSGRITYASTSGLLVDNDKFQYNGTNLVLLGGTNADADFTAATCGFGQWKDAAIYFIGCVHKGNSGGGEIPPVATTAPALVFHRSRGTQTTKYAVIENDRLGFFNCGGYDGAAFRNSAGINFYCDGAVSSGVVPQRIAFVTGTGGTPESTRWEYLVIKSDGSIRHNYAISPYVVYGAMTISGLGNWLFDSVGGINAGIQICSATTKLFGLWGKTPVDQPAALTTQLTTITYIEPGTPDYAIQSVQLVGYGFATADEGNSVLKVIANLQTRVAELESRLQEFGAIA
jgi:hypothetical protein